MCIYNIVIALVQLFIFVWTISSIRSIDQASQLFTLYASHLTAWSAPLSGCYRPYYHDNQSHSETENSLVDVTNPLVVMVSDRTYDRTAPVYEEGKCTGPADNRSTLIQPLQLYQVQLRQYQLF